MNKKSLLILPAAAALVVGLSACDDTADTAQPVATTEVALDPAPAPNPVTIPDEPVNSFESDLAGVGLPTYSDEFVRLAEDSAQTNCELLDSIPSIDYLVNLVTENIPQFSSEQQAMFVFSGISNYCPNHLDLIGGAAA